MVQRIRTASSRKMENAQMAKKTIAQLEAEIRALREAAERDRARIDLLVREKGDLITAKNQIAGDLETAERQIRSLEMTVAVANAKRDVTREMLLELYSEILARRTIAR